MTKSIGQTAREVILANPTLKNAELLTLVKEAHPEGKTTVACIAWYKNDLRKKGITSLPSMEEAPRTSEVIQGEIEMLQVELVETLEREAAEKVANAAAIQAEIERLMKLLPQEQQPTQ